jgi:hypothetical protein
MWYFRFSLLRLWDSNSPRKKYTCLQIPLLTMLLSSPYYASISCFLATLAVAVPDFTAYITRNFSFLYSRALLIKFLASSYFTTSGPFDSDTTSFVPTITTAFGTPYIPVITSAPSMSMDTGIGQSSESMGAAATSSTLFTGGNGFVRIQSGTCRLESNLGSCAEVAVLLGAWALFLLS